MATAIDRSQYGKAAGTGVTDAEIDAERGGTPDMTVDTAISNVLANKKAASTPPAPPAAPADTRDPYVARYFNPDGTRKDAAPTTDAATGTGDKLTDYYGNLKDLATMPDEARRQALRAQAQNDVATQLAAIDSAYNTIISDERARQQKTAALGNAQVQGVNRLSGLGGSSVAAARSGEQTALATEAERQAVTALQAKQVLEKAQTLGTATAAAEARFAHEQDLALKATEAMGTYQSNLAKGAKDAAITLNPGESAYDSTGKLIAHNPANSTEGKNVVLNEGDTLVDATGKTIAHGAAKTATPPASYQEYLLAHPGGDAAGYAKFITDKAAASAPKTLETSAGTLQFDEATNSWKPVTLNGAPVSGASTDKPLSGDAAKVLSIATTLPTEANQLKGILSGMTRQQMVAVLTGADADTSRLVDSLADKVGRLRSGGAINKDEAAAFKAQILRKADLITGDTSSAVAAIDRILTEAAQVADSMKKGGATNTTVPPPANQSEADADKFLDNMGKNNVGTDTNKGAVSVSIPQSSRLAFVNNNPGNLRFAGQSGASQGQGGFARFNSPAEGYRALHDQIALDASRGLTLQQFVYKYAPPTENNSSQYLQQMVAATGSAPNTPLARIDREAIARAMARKESSTMIG